MKKILPVEVDVANEAEFAQMKKDLDKYGFKFNASKEIDDAMTGKSPLAGHYIKNIVYKRNDKPFG